MNSKSGGILSIFITVFVMIALLSAGLILLLKMEFITLNEDVINNYFSKIKPATNIEIKIDLEEYEGTVNGSKLKEFVAKLGTNQYRNTITYISDTAYSIDTVDKSKANIVFMTNAKIANSEEYIKINNDLKYNIIIDRKEDKSVDKVYIIKLINNATI